MTAIHELSAAELSAAYARRTLSPVEVATALLARVDRWEPRLNAMYRVDREGALAAARAAEARWRADAPRSPLDGVPITIKENVYTRGDPAPIGTRANEDAPAAPADAPPAARVREAGCVILGKTTMPDYGMLSSGLSSIHGITRNPWRLDRNPSGSSAGAGAAAAARYAPLHIGTDIGGSIRLPATHCGLVGLKPSLGRVPIHPPYMGRVAGPMTRTVVDAALLLDVLARPDPRDFMSLPAEPARLRERPGRARAAYAPRRLPARHEGGAARACRGARRRRGGGPGPRAGGSDGRGDAVVPDARDARRHGAVLRGALPQRPHGTVRDRAGQGAALHRASGAPGGPADSPART